MIASNYIDLPTVNGYSSNSPPQFSKFFNSPTTQGLNKWLKYSEIDKSNILIISR